MLDIMEYYGRQRALCVGSLGTPEKSGGRHLPPPDPPPPNGASVGNMILKFWGGSSIRDVFLENDTNLFKLFKNLLVRPGA